MCEVRREGTAAQVDGGDPALQRDERTESGPGSEPAHLRFTGRSDPVLGELWNNDEDAAYDDFEPPGLEDGET